MERLTDVARVLDMIESQRSETVRLAQSLVRFDSVNDPPWGREGPCQAFVAEQMRDLGMEVDVFTPDQVPGIREDPVYLQGRDYTDRPNVVGTWRGTGGGRSLHLAAHADVVPIGDPARWDVDPFGGVIRDSKLYGRGVSDDKDGLTGMLAALRAIRRAGVRLHGDLIFSSYVDEEYAGGNGLLSVVRRGYRGDGAVNCDGVGFLLWIANTGGGPFRVLIQSRIDAPLPTASMREVQLACTEALTELGRDSLAEWSHPLYPPGSPAILKKGPVELESWEEAVKDWDWTCLGPACGIRGYVTTLPGQDRRGVRERVTSALDRAYQQCNCEDVYPPRVEWTYRFMDASAQSPEEPIVRLVGDAYQRISGCQPCFTGGVRSDLHLLALHGQVPTVSFGIGNTEWGGRGGAARAQ